MIYVEGHWETVNTLRDISRVIREYYNDEIADILDEFVMDEETKSKRYDKLNELFGLIQDAQDIANRMEDAFLDIE